ncbi:MAG: hypothetical protein A2Z83_05820 [Omnitrophica bacterium GWA2_52_8]|nr:MAG: hypothetical protein A2Z83_05820 [Omnitrophica bacterium GWA2_52_8]
MMLSIKRAVAGLLLFISPVLLMPVQAAEERQLAVQAPSPDAVVADFEGEDLMNKLGGESGSWNMDTTDENNSYTDADLVEVPGPDGKPAKVLRLTYSVESEVPSQNGFWTKLMGLDATPYDHLYFDVKGDEAKGFTTIFKVEIKKPKPDHRTPEEKASAQPVDPSAVEKIKGSFKVPVTGQWETVKIPLNKMTGLMDFGDPEAWKNPAIARRDLDELVIVFQDRMVSAKTGVIYLDNIRFVHTDNPGPTPVDFPPRKREKTETRLEGLEFQQFLVKRLGGFATHTVIKKEFPADDRTFLQEIARDTWKFFDEIVDKEHGLPLDTIQVGEKEALDDKAWIGDYTNVTNIGVYLMCLVSGYDLGFITREETVRRIQQTFTTLEKLEYHESGFPYNYYDTTTAERTSYFVSLVDSGWLVAGMYVAKNAFPEELSEQAERLIKRGNFNFFYDPVEMQMFHGFYENLQVASDYHYGVFYTEPRASSYIAIARGEVPEEHWFEGMIRTFPAEFGWQQMKPLARVPRTTLDHTYMGGYYRWKNLKYLPSWGGSAFEALMPTLILNEKELAPQGLGLNNKRHVQGQIRYALKELKQPVWGMSPSSVPEGGYSEFGAAPFGSKGYKPGVVTPHASVLALEYAPKSVIKNLRKLLELYDIYGDYGFYDAVTVETGLVARKYLSLDQGMIFVALNNYLNQGAIRKRFHAEPAMKSVEKLLTEEKFFQEPPDAVYQRP